MTPPLDPARKTHKSRLEKGQNSYYFWHEHPSTLPANHTQRHTHTQPTHNNITTHNNQQQQQTPNDVLLQREDLTTITHSSFCDDGPHVKLYVALDADLAGVNATGIDATFTTRTMRLRITPASSARVHQLYVDWLAHEINPEGCRAALSKPGNKCIVRLKKAAESESWTRLRG